MDEFKRASVGDLGLGRYSLEDVYEVFTRFGAFELFAELGFPELKLVIDTTKAYNDRLYVYDGIVDRDRLLMELRLRVAEFRPREQYVQGFVITARPMIMVDWFMLQDPRHKYQPQRPLLPKQNHPGLGIWKTMFPLIVWVIKDSGNQGALALPFHYHNAGINSRWFKFFSPEMEGRFQAMRRDLGSYPLHLVSTGFDLGAVTDVKLGKVAKWAPGEQIFPVDDELVHYFNHPGYASVRDRAMEEHAYQIDLELREQALREKEMKERSGGRRPAG